MLLKDLLPDLQAAVGPVILISGVGMLLLSMTNRLGRTIDRARQLVDAKRGSSAEEHRRYDAEVSGDLPQRLLRGYLVEPVAGFHAARAGASAPEHRRIGPREDSAAQDIGSRR